MRLFFLFILLLRILEDVMANGKLSAMVLKDINKLEKNLAKECAPKINKLFKESLNFAMVDWYNDYDPKRYNRTYNFMKVLNTAQTTGSGTTITMRVDSSAMSDYQGFDEPPYRGYEKMSLNAGIAFDFFFRDGEHGHGNWMMHRSIPPFMTVDRDVDDGFGNRVQDIISATMGSLLTKK